MTTLINTLQEIIRAELRNVRVAELGLVEAIYPHSDAGDNDNYGCDVRLKNSGLLLRRVPVASGHIGTVAIPNIGDLVLLAFDKGDINQPIVIGRLYNDDDRPPPNKEDEVIFRLPLEESDEKTVLGAIRNHPGGSEPREIIFEMPPKITVRITDGTVRATAGKTEMKLNQLSASSGGTVTVTSGRTKIVMNQDGDIAIEAAQAMSVKAATDLTLEAINVTIKGSGNVNIEAQGQATLKASGMANVQSSGSTTVQGAMVSIKGMTTFTP